MERLTFILDVVEPKVHSVRYRASEPNSPVESIYIAKKHLGKPPKAIVVTIEDIENIDTGKESEGN